MTLEVVRWHEKLALESGIEFRDMALISVAGLCSMCQGPKTLANSTPNPDLELKSEPKLILLASFLTFRIFYQQ